MTGMSIILGYVFVQVTKSEGENNTKTTVHTYFLGSFAVDLKVAATSWSGLASRVRQDSEGNLSLNVSLLHSIRDLS